MRSVLEFGAGHTWGSLLDRCGFNLVFDGELLDLGNFLLQLYCSFNWSVSMVRGHPWYGRPDGLLIGSISGSGADGEENQAVRSFMLLFGLTMPTRFVGDAHNTSSLLVATNKLYAVGYGVLISKNSIRSYRCLWQRIAGATRDTETLITCSYFWGSGIVMTSKHKKDEQIKRPRRMTSKHKKDVNIRQLPTENMMTVKSTMILQRRKSAHVITIFAG